MKRTISLKEDADSVYLNGKKIVGYTDGPNIAFIIYKHKGNIYGEYVDSRETNYSYASHSSVRLKIQNKFPDYNYDDDEIQGRIWPDKMIAATYQGVNMVAMYVNLIEKIFDDVRLDPNDFKWDFSNSYELNEFPTWIGKQGEKSKEVDPKLKKEMDDLIQKIHLATPEDKKKIRIRLSQLQKMIGGSESELDSYIKDSEEKIAKSLGNYNSQAELNFYKGSIAEVEFEQPEMDKNTMPFPVSIKNIKDGNGYWISPEGQIYDVDKVGGHANFAEEYIFKIKNEHDWQEKVNNGTLKYRDIRLDVLMLGWVRIRFHFSQFYQKLSKGHNAILEIQAIKINPKQRSIIERLVKEKDALAISAEEFDKYEREIKRMRVMKKYKG